MIEKLLAPWPADRPSACTVPSAIRDFEAALSPELSHLALSGDTRFQAGGQEIVLELNVQGTGLLSDLDWIDVESQGEILEKLHPELNGKAPDSGVLAAGIRHSARLTLPKLARGSHSLEIIAQVGAKCHTQAVTVEVTYSAEQLWQHGDPESALKQELREAWLEELYKHLNSVTSAYRFLQMLEGLKAHHPGDRERELLDAFQRRTEHWQAPKPDNSEKPYKPVRPKLRVWLKRLFVTTILLYVLITVPGVWNWIAQWLGEVSGPPVNRPPEPSEEEDLKQAKALLEGDDETQRPYAIPVLSRLAKSGNSEAMRLLGLSYYLGLGVVKDEKLGCQSYRKAA